MQFQVPQFIESEDTIIGPLTMRQFGYLCIAGGLSGICYLTLNIVAWIFFSIIFFAIAIIIGFIPIEGQSMLKIISAYVKFFWNPQHYVWQPNKQRVSKKEDELGSLAPQGSPLENIVLGFFLKQAWREIQTGQKISDDKSPDNEKAKATILNERYKIFRRMSGERHAARRIDYR